MSDAKKVRFKVDTFEVDDQAILIVSERKNNDGTTSISLSVHGTGTPRKLVDNVLQAFQEMMRSDPEFAFESA